jgi:Uma2 family endonuclease
MAANPKAKWTIEAYLDHERESDIRHEYYLGEIFAMAGAEPVHVDIGSNVISSLVVQTKGRNCKVHNPDMRVTTATGLYTYPDISVVCGERRFNTDKPKTLLNPMVIIEVLSPSTENYDRGDIFHHYASISELRAYVLIDSQRRRIECFSRQEDGAWRIDLIADGDARPLELSAIACSLTLAEVYEGVDLDNGEG